MQVFKFCLKIIFGFLEFFLLFYIIVFILYYIILLLSFSIIFVINKDKLSLNFMFLTAIYSQMIPS